MNLNNEPRINAGTRHPGGSDTSPRTSAALSLRGISKSYPGVQALEGVDLDVWPGECHALLGQNGAGKSTLVKVMSGVEVPTEGEIILEGSPRRFGNPGDAQANGIYTIHQELSLAPGLSVAENIYLSDLPTTRAGLVDWNRLHRRATEDLLNLGFDIPADTPVGTLSMAEQQAVEIAKAVHRKARVILLDEPTATLPKPEVEKLFELVERLRGEGVAIVFISHRLDEVYRLCDRITVMRDGRKVLTRTSAELPEEEAVRAMVGENLIGELVGQLTTGGRRRINPRTVDSGKEKPMLEVRNLSDSHLLDEVALSVMPGEAVAVTGLVGSGQSELAACLFGSRPHLTGEFLMRGRQVSIRTPRDAIKAGLGWIPEDRKSQGLVLDMSVQANISMPSLHTIRRFGFRRGSKERRLADGMIHSLGIRVRDADQHVGTLSGGNQQKVVFAKWIAAGAELLIVSEPTRGVDVAAKETIYKAIGTYLAQGGSVLLITSEIEEALMSDRIYVMQRGRLSTSFAHDMIDSDGLLSMLR
ncbi:sugar ABC transporter ATP-binding protein [Arthrobacter sp. MA-N2]|uniref:sugar ABC transporter ATP-binding protein n=1 Tax=Arthrobacter sp. MA-N2 TaxID=1101188 RepID=UPI0004B967C3|nr:sugar ABC transporter ATP-binding protein [Arthrobacter sp. MA-N2]